MLAIMLWATRRIGVGDTHAAERQFALPEGRLIALGLIALLAVFSEASVTDWSALYLSRELGWTPAAAAVGFSAYAGTMFLGRLFGDGAIRRLGRADTILCGAGLILVGASIAVAPGAPWPAVIGFCLVGFGVANMVPAAFSASAAAGQTPSIGVAMTATVAYASYLLGPLAVRPRRLHRILARGLRDADRGKRRDRRSSPSGSARADGLLNGQRH